MEVGALELTDLNQEVAAKIKVEDTSDGLTNTINVTGYPKWSHMKWRDQ
jgi:hypothetical protein